MKAKLFVCLLLLGGCAEGERETAQVPAESALTAADTARVLEEGGAIATAVAQGLAGRLQAELAAEGPAGAVDFCSQTALGLTDSLVSVHPTAMAVKRTSMRIRNSQNAPDALEREAIAWFESMRAASGEWPAAHVQAAGAGEVRYYRPLMIAPFCTTCHGDAEQIDPQVRQILAERYPEDQATGYREGDMRGVIRVSLPRD
jgi:hypothetical protein